MSQKQTGFKSAILSVSQLKRKLKELTQEKMIEFMIDVVKSNKDIQSFVSVKLQGEHAIVQLFEEFKQKIYMEFYPIKGLPKLRVAVIGKAISDMKNVSKGTFWLLELMIYFCEIAVQHIHENGDIFEDMADLLTDTYEAVIQTLNKEKTPNLYEKYHDRVLAIVKITGCECWGIHDSLEWSYSMLKWADQ